MGAYKILLADDNQTSLKLLKAVYESEGYEVYTANDGLEALEILYQQKIDLLISDVLMPNMDGYYLCYKIRTSDKLRDLPIIIYTATYTSLSEEKVAGEMGADMFIRKPAAINVLIAGAKDILARPGITKHAVPKAKASEMMHQYNAQLIEKLEERNQELEQAQKDLEYTIANLKKAQQISHLGNWEIIFATGITTWSDETYRIFGVLPEEVEASVPAFLSFVHPDDREFVKSTIENAEATLLSFSFYKRIIRKDGALRYVFIESKFEFDGNGKPLKRYGIIHDITDRKEAEDKLRHSEANLRLIIDAMPHVISAKDRYGRFIFVNKAFGELYGVETDRLINTRADELMPVKGEANKFFEEDQQILKSGIAKVIKAVSFTDSKGNVRIFQSNKMPFTPTGTDETAILSIGVEITEMKRAEEKLKMIQAELVKLNTELEERVRQRTDALEEANKELESYSYTVSHDLRTPVRAMQIFSSLLQKQFKDNSDPDTNDYLNNILKCTVEMNDLLEFSRLGRHELEKSLVDMETMVNVYSKNLIALEDNKKIEIDIGHLLSVTADHKVIKNVWLNLLSNAIKYSKKEGVCKIEVSCKKQKNMAVYTVKDNGIGFNMQYYNKLFKPFSRLHSSSEYKGTGAGLAICDRIIKKHGGEIWAESEVDKGTVFHFSLPL